MLRALPALLITAALPLSAQDGAIGARLQGLAVVGDLRNVTSSQAGLGGAVFLSIPATESLVLRPLVGFQFIPRGNTPGLADTKTAVTSIDLMVDALWFPGSDPEHGAYLLGSVGIQQWRVNATGAAASTFSATRLGVNAGLGYQATPHLAFEAKGFWSPVKADLTATGLAFGATYRF